MALKKEFVETLETMAKNNEFMDYRVAEQKSRTTARLTTDEWLDENENEWRILDNLCRSRPWATNRDKAFPFPFRQATREMRQAGEVGWVGDHPGVDQDSDKPTKRMEAPNDLLINMKTTVDYPPAHRMLMFTPEFASAESYDSHYWAQLEPRDKTDIWIVNWQGWAKFDEMIEEVFRWVKSFSDGVSTVWFGHSMGAIVLYECLKRLQKFQAPNLPVAVFVSGCPAPHLFAEEYRPYQKYPWLGKMRVTFDFELLNAEQSEVLSREFSMPLDGEPDTDAQLRAVFGRKTPGDARPKPDAAKATAGQRNVLIHDLKMMKRYEFAHGENRIITLPLYVVRSEEDELVNEAHADAWKDYTDDNFEVFALEDHEDSELLATLGHGFARYPPKSLLEKVREVAKKYQINKDIRSLDMLPDIGPTDGPIPEYADCVVIGSGITGVVAARAFKLRGLNSIIFEKTDAIGGIWEYYANIYSRVNTSEVGYRIFDQVGRNARPNQDHSPTHDIMRDIHAVGREYAYGNFRCGWNVDKVEKQPDDTYVVTGHSMKGKGDFKIRCKVIQFAINRRIGKRRDVIYPDEKLFRGDICYGYANELAYLKFWGKRVIVVGAGAFAYENLRTSLEHGARHATILGRRAGTTCPKWIDMIAFLRPMDHNYNTHRAGNMISFQCWQKCFHDAGVPTPECWAEGLLKPHNHTVSVSDLAFIGGYHGLASLLVGEIKRFRSDGHGVELVDGRSLDCDIVIKCTGFHLNEDVPKICGQEKMYASTLIDFNMAYIAEPLLDGGQFGSARGMADSTDIEAKGADAVIAANYHKISQLPPYLQNLFAPHGNPFGSGYVGGLVSSTDYIAWLAVNEDKQRQAIKAWGAPRMHCVRYWASHIGRGTMEELKAILAKAVAEDEEEKVEGHTELAPVEEKVLETVLDKGGFLAPGRYTAPVS